MGKVVLDLTDPEPPAVAVSGPLAAGGRWSRGQGTAGLTIDATDPGSGVSNVRLTAQSPGRAPRTVGNDDAPCDPSHSQAKPAGREAAICPDSLRAQFGDSQAGLPEGETTYTATATDLSQRTASRSFMVRIDRTRPTRLTAGGPLTRLFRKWTNTRRTYTLVAGASDARSGVARLELRDGQTLLAAKDHPCASGARPCPGRWTTPLGVDLGRLREGRHRLTLRALDVAGNVTQPRMLGELLVDRTPPTAPKGKVQVASNGTTARWSSYDGASRLDFFKVRLEQPGGRVSFRAVRPGGGQESTTRSGRLFKPGVKAASITVAAHDRAGNVAAARIQCRVPYSLRYCAQQRRKAAKKRRGARRRVAAKRRRLTRSCRSAHSKFVSSTKAWGKALSRFRDKVDEQARVADQLLKRALELRTAAQRYEARASDNSVATARAYREAYSRFQRATKRRKAAGRATVRSQRKLDRLARTQRRAARTERSLKVTRSCRHLTKSQAKRLEKSRNRWDRGVRRGNKRDRAARAKFAAVAKIQLRVIEIRRQAVTARGRGLLKTTSVIAQTYQPILNVDRSDGFWPVRFDTIYRYRRDGDGFNDTCIKYDNGNQCAETATPGSLADPLGGGQHLDYPAPSDSRDKQHDMLMRAAGGYGQRPAMYYFRTLGEKDRKPNTSAALQYWFYYTFNYQTSSAGIGGRHEGDFEHVAIVLSRYTGRPRYVFMARHGPDEASRQDEPLRYSYDDLDNPRGVRHEGTHLKVYAAHGSHAIYPKCGKHGRSGLPPDDHTCQGPVATFGTDTPLMDLARSRWACWKGRFGEPGPHKIRNVDARGPPAPLRQQKNYYRDAEPCDRGGAPPPTGPLSSAASASTQATRRSGGVTAASAPQTDSALDPFFSLDYELADESEIDQAKVEQRMEAGETYDRYFNTCDQWMTPPTEPGVKVVACDQRILTRFFGNGLEDTGPERVRIVDPSRRALAAQASEPSVPAVYDTADANQANTLRVLSNAPARPSVSVAQKRPDGSTAQATFPPVPVSPGSALRMRVSGSVWALLDSRGRTLARVRPTADGHHALTRPGRVRARQRGRRLVVRWRAREEPRGTRFVIQAARAPGARLQRLKSVQSQVGQKAYRWSIGSRGFAFVRVTAVHRGRKRPSDVVRVSR